MWVEQWSETSYYGFGVFVVNGWIVQNPSFAGYAATMAYLPSHKLAVAVAPATRRFERCLPSRRRGTTRPIAEAELDVDYGGSPIVMGDEHDALAPGQRLPDTIEVYLASGGACMLHELTNRAGHTALLIGGLSVQGERLARLDSSIRAPERRVRRRSDRHAHDPVPIFHSKLQVWVDVGYSRYRQAYRRAFPTEDIKEKILSHAMNRRMATILGFRFVRITPISRRSNSSSGFSEKLGVELYSKPTELESHRRRDLSIRYADLVSLMLMLDIKLGGGIVNAVNEGQRLVRLKP